MPSQDTNAASFFTGGQHKVDVMAHRGGNGEWPGETLFAFRNAKQLGVDVLEMDIRVTRDEQLVIMHNPTVRATTKGWLPVRCYTLAEIQKLNAGYDWSPEGSSDHPYRDSQDPDLLIPSFAQVLERFSDMRLNVEIKGWHPLRADPIAREFYRLLVKYDMTKRVLIASFHEPVLRVIRDLDREIAISASTLEVARFVASSRWGSGNYKPDSPVIQTLGCTVNAKLVETARQHGLKLHAFTIDKAEEMDRLIGLGVDGIITNFPSRLLERPGLTTR